MFSGGGGFGLRLRHVLRRRKIRVGWQLSRVLGRRIRVGWRLSRVLGRRIRVRWWLSRVLRRRI
jgi:hypothetical protein